MSWRRGAGTNVPAWFLTQSLHLYSSPLQDWIQEEGWICKWRIHICSHFKTNLWGSVFEPLAVCIFTAIQSACAYMHKQPRPKIIPPGFWQSYQTLHHFRFQLADLLTVPLRTAEITSSCGNIQEDLNSEILSDKRQVNISANRCDTRGKAILFSSVRWMIIYELIVIVLEWQLRVKTPVLHSAANKK